MRQIIKSIFLLLLLIGLSSAQNIQTLINNAISSNSRELVLPSGTYKINTPISIYNAYNLKIRGNGTKLLFNPTISKDYDIQIMVSNTVTLQDLELDNDPLPFTQGRVISVDKQKNSFEVEIHAQYSRDSARFGHNCYVHIHDPNSKRFKQEGEMLYTNYSEPIAQGLRFYLKTDTIDYFNLKVNDLVSIGQPGFTCAISLYNTRNTLLDNVRIYSAPGCGVLENSGGGTVINNLKILRGQRPDGSTQDRLLSVNRDGMHLNGPNGGSIIKNSFVEFTGDDGINIRSEFSRVISVSGNVIVHSVKHVNFETGTQLNVYDENDLSLKDTVIVLDHQMGSDTARVDRSDKILPGNFIISPQHTQNFKILNNTFQDIDARGIVASGSNIHIEGNVVERTTMAGIWVGAELGHYNEGDFAKGVYVRWNRLAETNFALRGRRAHTHHIGAISVVNEIYPLNPNYKYKRPNRNVWIVENVVSQSGLASLFLAHTYNAGICKNSFFNDNNLYFNNAGYLFGIDARYSIVIHDTSTVKLFQNWVIVGTNSLNMRSTTDSDTVIDPATNPCV